MAKNTQKSTACRNAEADAFMSGLNSGTLEIYDGTQPATADTAVTTQNKLYTIPFNATAESGSASGGVATAAAFGSGTFVAGGTATWCRAKASGGGAWVDGSVGTSGCNLNLGSTTITSGIPVTITSWTYTDLASVSGQ